MLRHSLSIICLAILPTLAAAAQGHDGVRPARQARSASTPSNTSRARPNSA